MSCASCNDTSNKLDQHNNWMCSYSDGGVLKLRDIGAPISIAGFREPNVMLTSTKPDLRLDSTFFLNVAALTSEVSSLNGCNYVVGIPAPFNGLWETNISSFFTTPSGAVNYLFSANNSGGGMFACATTSSSNTQDAPGYSKCSSGDLKATDYEGYVINGSLKASPTSGKAYVSNNSNKVVMTGRVAVTPGDTVEIDQTNINFSSGVTITSSYRGVFRDQPATILVLSAPVVPSSSATAVDGTYCVYLTAKHTRIAQLSFSVECGCMLNIVLTPQEAAKLPSGGKHTDDPCGGQIFCCVVYDKSGKTDKSFTNYNMVIS